MSLLLAKARKYSVAFWLVAGAIIIEDSCSLSWWHPDCNSQDSPGYFGIGFPLPYARLTGASSLEYSVMPHVYLLDLVFIGALLYPFLRFILVRIAAKSLTAATIVACSGLAFLLLVVIALSALVAISGWYIPVMSIGDSYWSYRPTFIWLQLGNQACYR